MGKDVRAGKAYVELGIRDRLEKGLKSARRKLQNFGTSSLRTGAAGFLGAGALIAPIISAASEAQEVASKFDTVFGSNAETVRNWGNDFADAVGRSETMIEQFMGSSQDLFVPLGFDDETATDLSKTLTTLSVDLASFNNKNDADVLNDLQAAMTGSGEVMKKYGVILSQAAVNQELLNQGLDPKAATNAQKVQARLNIVMRNTTAAQGDATRTAGSFANQSKRLWAMIDNVAGSLGDLLMPAATKGIGVLNDLAGSAAEFIDENETLVAGVLAGVAAIGTLAGLLMTAGGAAIVGGAAMSAIGSAIAFVTSAAAALAGPALVVAGLLAAIGGAAYVYREPIMAWGAAFWETVEPVRSALSQIWSTASEVFDGVRSLLAAGEYRAAASALWAGVQAVFLTGAARVADGLSWLYGQAASLFGRIREAAIAGLTRFAAPIVPVVEGVLSVFDWLGAGVRDTLGGIGNALMSGDIALAGQILWVTLESVWVNGTAPLRRIWARFLDEFGGTFQAAGDWIASAFWSLMDMVAWVNQTMDRVVNAILQTFLSMVQTITELIGSLTEKVSGVLRAVAQYDPSGQAQRALAVVDKISQLYGSTASSIAKAQDDADKSQAENKVRRAKETSERIAAIEARQTDVRDRRAALLAQASEQRGDRNLDDAAGDRLLRIRELVDRVEAAEAEAEADEGVADAPQTDELADQQEDGLDRGDRTTRTSGTFSAFGAALLGLGGTGAEEKTAANTERIANAMDELVERDPQAPQFA